MTIGNSCVFPTWPCWLASMADPNAQNALRHLQETATFLRVLGSYPADDSTL